MVTNGLCNHKNTKAVILLRPGDAETANDSIKPLSLYGGAKGVHQQTLQFAQSGQQANVAGTVPTSNSLIPPNTQNTTQLMLDMYIVILSLLICSLVT